MRALAVHPHRGSPDRDQPTPWPLAAAMLRASLSPTDGVRMGARGHE